MVGSQKNGAAALKEGEREREIERERSGRGREKRVEREEKKKRGKWGETSRICFLNPQLLKIFKLTTNS